MWTVSPRSLAGRIRVTISTRCSSLMTLLVLDGRTRSLGWLLDRRVTLGGELVTSGTLGRIKARAALLLCL